nr:hypothetical protein [Mycoplasmopsis bovis]
MNKNQWIWKRKINNIKRILRTEVLKDLENYLSSYDKEDFIIKK